MQDPLSRIDLNLLVAFQVLMQEKSVTRAAERLFVTQPAMSKTLNRLRNLIDDELFVRSSHGLTPTPKTLELEAPVNDIINRLTDLVVKTQEFDPASTTATISLATLGNSANIGLPPFINKLRITAPNILLISQNIDVQYEERLRGGSLDFAIVAKSHFSNEFIAHKIMDIKPMLYMRKDHPLANANEISLAERRKYQHMAVYFPNFETTREEISKLFASFGVLSNVPFLTSNLMLALEVLSTSDMLMIASDRLNASSLIKDNFVCKPFMDVINMKIDTLYLVRHIRTKNSALHNYLVDMIIESFAADLLGSDSETFSLK